ncbi:MAG TPA: ABC transporter ATP-binding protein [Acidimicrobiia bacterium]|nr:ABC transporter ATP-binding protein [Acidimicrobiia bacterium]
MLVAEGISSGYLGVTVIKEIDLSMGHEIFAILGANGAGKTTLLATLAGVVPMTGGSLSVFDQNVTDMAPWERAGLGLAYVPQEKGIFPDLTVMENLHVGSMIGTRNRQERIDEVVEIFPDIAARQSQLAGTLSGGESRMVAVGRALMQDPKLLLLDEPTAGLSPLYVEQFFEKITEIHESKGVGILLAEQNATKALEVAHRVMVLSLGRGTEPEAVSEMTLEKLKEGYRI